MPKQIKVSDEIYARLKADADQNYRSMGGQIEYMLDQAVGVHKILGQKVAFAAPPENTPYQNPGGTPPSNKVDDLFPKKSEVATPPIADASGTRGKGDILADIRETEADRDEELRNCQDPDTSRKITNRYASTIDGLWKEYHACTNA